ncbi:MAG: SdrD B-like domain-containing protein [Paracoccus sp. (in: a-proteobacteria)]|uniref:SdrD B-like domain-containing protein n=1 Tax=Paracoccus sp. TaxID=267 RepID=UPI0026E0442B|nr:SdrD B-like domain-containing protein [Paracoccus sp. (in: a-proteobacteria)]MDO5631676.1 SdrD B-like domain-containing protein [Paracoccus sp. (in: a-proteobacteria)]
MTYYYSTTKTYTWTAFTEADLLANGKNGSDFGLGDTFVMPKSATVTMSTKDNDGALSGGSKNWWTGKTQSTDRTGQDATINGTGTGGKMYADKYHVLKGSDGKTYYLIDIIVEGHDSPGAGNGYFTFYGATPPAGVSLSVVQTCAVSGSWVNYNCLGAGSSAPPNTPPTFTNVPKDGVFCIDENNTLVIKLNATDADGDKLTFKIIGGTDAGSFVIDAKTGELSFVKAPDYETPGSKAGTNTYKVIVAVDDGKGGVQNKELTVCVKDVDEGTPACQVIEAESMTLCNMRVGSVSGASEGKVIGLTGYSGYAYTTYKGPAGEFDMTMRYTDTAGSGSIRVYVNNKLVQTVSLNKDNNRWNEVTIENLNLKPGDVIKLSAEGKYCEYAKIDKLTLCPSGPSVGALEGRVFIDQNKDGLDNSEPGVQGVTVQLLDANGNLVATTTTGADGSYLFGNLQPGNYTVVFPTSVNGRVLTHQNVGDDDTIDSDANVVTGRTDAYAVVAGETTSNVDAGLKDPGTASLEGRAFLDSNKDGLDNNEPGIPGQTVQLLDANGNVVAVTTTGADGSYKFDGLDAGTYTVVFPTDADGRVLTAQDVGNNDTIDSDANPSTGRTGSYTVNIGQNVKDVDAGYKDPGTASLEGRAFVDANRDGIDNNEPGIAGQTVQLLNAAGVVIATTTTAADGSYRFTNLDAGNYSVQFPTTANGRVLTQQDVGNDDTVDSDASQTTGRTGSYTVNVGDNVTDVDAGYKDPGTASLGDYVWVDSNRNGIQDNGDTGRAGVTVTLYDAATGAVVATTTTDANGKYLFTGLLAGDYQVGFARPDGYSFTTANAGSNDAIDSDAAQATGRTGTISLAIGETNLTVDAGLVRDNRAPVANNDSAHTCADKAVTVDVLANDTDADGDALSITHVAGRAIADGQTLTLSDGVRVTLTSGQLVFDASGTAYEDQIVGTSTTVSYGYSISDGMGGTASAAVDMKWCGVTNTLESIKASLPDSGVLRVTLDRSFDGAFYTATVTGTGDARLDGKSFDIAYCVSAYDNLPLNTNLPVNIYLADEDSLPSNTQIPLPQNLDKVNWILNQDFGSRDNGDGTNTTYTEAEIQGAIWGLTDGIVFVQPDYNYGTTANAQEIYDLAMAQGNGFEPGEGDIIGLILEPTGANGNHEQPFIIGVNWNDLALDCLC